MGKSGISDFLSRGAEQASSIECFLEWLSSVGLEVAPPVHSPIHSEGMLTHVCACAHAFFIITVLITFNR